MQHDLRHARFHQTFVHAKLTKAPNTNLLKLIWYSRTDTKNAYVLRSSYLHASRGLPRELIVLAKISRAETVRVERRTILTFEGLSRLVRHVILQFVSRQESVSKEPCDYFKEEPGIIRAELTSEYWLHLSGNFIAKDGQKRLFAFCGQLATAMRTHEPPKVSDMRDLLGQALHRLPDMKPRNRLPFLALFYLYNLAVTVDLQIDDNRGILQLYEKELTTPTVEAMLLALLTQCTLQWPLDEHDITLRTYFDGKGRDEGIRIDNLFEVGLILELAERYRVHGDTDKAKGLIHFAVENHPGNESLIQFELEFDPSKQIKWQEVMELKH